MFFQEEAGAIRESIYGMDQWAAPSNYVIAIGRNSTPLAAISIPEAKSQGLDDVSFGGIALIVREVNDAQQIYVFYISPTNIIECQYFRSGREWQPLGVSLSLNSSIPVTVHPQTKSLSASYLPEGSNSTTFDSIYLIFEDVKGKASLLFSPPGIVEHASSSISGNLAFCSVSIPLEHPDHSPAALEVGAPFGMQSSRTLSGVGTVFIACTIPNNSIYSVVQNAYSNGNFMDVIAPSFLANGYDNIQNSDLSLTNAWFLWVNNATLMDANGNNVPAPLSPFPYSRFSTSNVGTGSNFYLYHQINGTTFAEDLFDSSIGHFTSSFFSIGTS